MRYCGRATRKINDRFCGSLKIEVSIMVREWLGNGSGILGKRMPNGKKINEFSKGEKDSVSHRHYKECEMNIEMM